MGLIVNKADFVGKYNLAKSITDKIDAFISQYETKLIYELFGKELGDLFIADLSNQAPQSTRFTDIFGYLEVEIYCEDVVSDGIKDMLLGFIYTYYKRDYPIQDSMVGSVQNDSETAQKVDLSFILRPYNDAVRSHNVIQTYMKRNYSTYPEFNGKEKRYAGLI